MTYKQLEKELIAIFRRDNLPEADRMINLTAEVNGVLISEDPGLRPRDESDLPGGIIFLDRSLPAIIVPDIHARLDFVLSVLLQKCKDGGNALERLFRNELQIVCLGDGMHSEGRSIMRWKAASAEFFNNYSDHENMDDEMRESLGVMEMVLRVKNACPRNFHFLKGNHENISNEEGNGNYPYIKYAYEGEMVASYLEKFYGQNFIGHYYQFERNLPLMAAGKNFLVSHAEPASFYTRDEIINYRKNPEVVEGLTWTDNDAADNGSIACMLTEYLDWDFSRSFYFGGHRPVDELYNIRAGGKYVQIHNPDKFIIAKIDQMKDINLDEDIIELENAAKRIGGCYAKS